MDCTSHRFVEDLWNHNEPSLQLICCDCLQGSIFSIITMFWKIPKNGVSMLPQLGVHFRLLTSKLLILDCVLHVG